MVILTEIPPHEDDTQDNAADDAEGTNDDTSVDPDLTDDDTTRCPAASSKQLVFTS